MTPRERAERAERLGFPGRWPKRGRRTQPALVRLRTPAGQAVLADLEAGTITRAQAADRVGVSVAYLGILLGRMRKAEGKLRDCEVLRTPGAQPTLAAVLSGRMKVGEAALQLGVSASAIYTWRTRARRQGGPEGPVGPVGPVGLE